VMEKIKRIYRKHPPVTNLSPLQNQTSRQTRLRLRNSMSMAITFHHRKKESMRKENQRNISHFVFLSPGEKLFVITRSVAGEDYTQVVEVIFPTCGTEDDIYFDPKQGCHQEARAMFEDTMIFNMLDFHELETGCKTNVTDVVSHQVAPEGSEIYISVCQKWANKHPLTKDNKEDAEALNKLGVEMAD